VLAKFADPAGGFYSSSSDPRDHEVLLARVCLRLARRSPVESTTGTASYRAAADRTIAAFRGLVARAPSGTMAFVREIAERVAMEAAGGAPTKGEASARVGPVAVEAFVDRTQARPGAAVEVCLRVAIDAGWHVNASGALPQDRVPVSLAVEGKAPVDLRDLRFPAATRSVPAPGGVPLGVYEGTVDLRATLAIAPGAALGPRRVVLALSFQPCSETVCEAPAVARLEVPLRIDLEDGEPRHPGLFAAARR